MIDKIIHTKKGGVKLKPQSSTGLQSGSDAATVKSQLFSANQSIVEPSLGPTYSTISPSELVKKEIDDGNGFTDSIKSLVGMTGSWLSQGKIQKGTSFILKRGSIVESFDISRIFVDTGSTSGHFQLKLGNYFTDKQITLDSFLGIAGYNQVGYDVEIKLDQHIEQSSVPNAISNTFNVVPKAVTDLLFDLQCDWNPDPAISVVAIRWRPTPSIRSVSEITFSIGSSGAGYTVPPTLTVYNEFSYQPGYGAACECTIDGFGHINSVTKTTEGGGYLWYPLVGVSGDGVGGDIAADVNTSIFPRLNYIRVTNSGTGYTAGSIVAISGGSGADSDIGAPVIRDNQLVAIQLFSPTRDYSYIPPSVIVSGGTGAEFFPMTDSGSSWIYESATTNPFTIKNLSRGIEYEVQILKSNDPLFRGPLKYSDSTKVYV